MQKGYLILENGQVFPGVRCGAPENAVGELVFTTGMTGYLETLTDPSYYGQIVMQTFPLIGNYGVIPADFESARAHVRAYVARELCADPSNFRAAGALSEWLAAQGIPCLTGVDTRQLTRIVRERGVMNAILSAEPVLSDADKRALRNYRVREAVEKSIPCLTAIDTANALADSMESRYNQHNTELVDLNHRRRHRERLRFSKMQACGNDYLCFDCRRQRIDNPASLAVRLSERHFGIGAEGVCLLFPSEKADFRMVVYNLDGTIAALGGNAISCLAKYAYDKGIVPPERLTVSVETTGGVRAVRLFKRNGIVRAAEVEMGKARFESVAVPVELPVPRVVDYPVALGRGYRITCVNVGNPHAVAFVEDVDTLDIAAEGPQLEHAAIFPERANAEFVRALDETTLRMRVWERGNGETWACGTGACAAVAAAVENGLCAQDTDIAVKVPGGVLSVRYCPDGMLRMRTEVDLVFEGVVEL